MKPSFQELPTDINSVDDLIKTLEAWKEWTCENGKRHPVREKWIVYVGISWVVTKLHDLTSPKKDMTQNRWGVWVPAIPSPLVGGLPPKPYRCSCGSRFFTLRGYKGHYALVHVLGMDR